jgi:hypothetical protein
VLVCALVTASSATPAQTCGMSVPKAPTTKCIDCCATMKSCVLAQQNPAQPTAAGETAPHWVTLIAPVLRELLSPAIPALSRPVYFAPAQPLAPSPSRFALFCTFLI